MYISVPKSFVLYNIYIQIVCKLIEHVFFLTAFTLYRYICTPNPVRYFDFGIKRFKMMPLLVTLDLGLVESCGCC